MSAAPDDEDLLRALGGVAKEQREEIDPRLEKLLAGTLTDEERAEIEADPELRELAEAFRPLDAREQSAIVAKLPTQARVVPLRPIVPAIAAVLAIAAGAFFFVSNYRAALPVYVVSVTGGDREVRSAEGPQNEVRTLSPDSRIDVVLRPERAPGGALEAHAYFAHDGILVPAGGALQVSSDGAVRLLGTAREVFGDFRGDGTLLVVVGRPPATLSNAQAQSGDTPKGFAIARVRVHLVR